MPLIITATDFSKTGENAVDYACKLATDRQASLVVIHTFNIPVMFSDIPMPGTLVNDAQQDAEEQLSKLISTMAAAYPSINISGKVIFGDTADALDEYTTNGNEPWLIVIGNNTEENTSWPDSTLMSIFKRMKYPVLAVPPGYTSARAHKLCFAFDNKHKVDDEALQQIKKVVAPLGAELHVLTVQPHNTADVNESAISQNVKDQLAAINPIYHSVYDIQDVDAAIRDFAEKNTIDWLILIPHKHSFFEGLFHKSHTKAIAKHAGIPILALREG